MKTPSIVGAQPRGKVVCAAACSSQLGRMSTNFGYYFYLQSVICRVLFAEYIVQPNTRTTEEEGLHRCVRVIPKRTVGAPTGSTDLLGPGVHAGGCSPGESPFLHDHRVRPRPFLPHGRHLTCIMDAPSRESPSSQAMRGLVQRSVAASVRPANIWRVSSASGFITCPTGVGSLESLPDPPSSGVILPADGTGPPWRR